MNSSESTSKRELEVLTWQKDNGKVFSPILDLHYERLRTIVADAEQRRERRMSFWRIVNTVTFGFVKLPVDEPAIEIPKHLKDSYDLKTEKAYALHCRNKANPPQRVLRSANSNTSPAHAEPHKRGPITSGDQPAKVPRTANLSSLTTTGAVNSTEKDSPTNVASKEKASKEKSTTNMASKEQATKEKATPANMPSKEKASKEEVSKKKVSRKKTSKKMTSKK